MQVQQSYKHFNITESPNSLVETRQQSRANLSVRVLRVDFQADGERTGKYIVTVEEFTLNSSSESVISYVDYAVVMVDKILNGNNIQKRISVVKA